MAGRANAIGHVKLSFSKPTVKDMMAPPTIEVDKRPDAFVVCFPKPFTEREKMVANIIELHKPTVIMLQIAKGPDEVIEITIKNTAHKAQAFNTTGGFKVLSKKDPIKRPASMLPQ